eukprot:3508848-Amphidinium_carterae.1
MTEDNSTFIIVASNVECNLFWKETIRNNLWEPREDVQFGWLLSGPNCWTAYEEHVELPQLQDSGSLSEDVLKMLTMLRPEQRQW